MIKLNLNSSFFFQEKVKIFSREYLAYSLYLLEKKSDDDCIDRISFYSKFAAVSGLLHDFLIFHKSQNSMRWKFYTEICAIVKYFSCGAYWQKHVIKHAIHDEILECKTFISEAKKALLFFNRTLVFVADKAIQEATQLNIFSSDNVFRIKGFPSMKTREFLEHDDITIKSKEIEEKNVVKIATNFLLLASNFKKLGLLSEKINSSSIKYFGMLTNDLRIFFYKNFTQKNISFSCLELIKLKNCLDTIFYLSKVSGFLLSVYEQHFRKEETLFNSQELIYWSKKFSLNYIYILLKFIEKSANRILNQNIEISSIKVSVPIDLGFHTRPSLLVAKIVQHYGGKVYLKVGDDKFDASSVLSIQWAGGKIQKEKIKEVIFSGDTRALNDIKLLASINYGENTMGKGISMPNELEYLI